MSRKGIFASIVSVKNMDISYLGHSSFKFKGKTGSVVTDPYDSSIGLKFSKTEADIVTVSHHHSDHDKVSDVSAVRKVVEGPGEYEIQGISIIGIPSFHDNKKGEERGKNTIYVFEIDGLRLCHLGDLGHELPQGIIDDIGTIDILMVPVGGHYTIGPEEAVKVVQTIEPSIVIPMHFKAEGMNESFNDLSDLDVFLKTLASPVENLPKLSISKETLSESELKVCVLEKK